MVVHTDQEWLREAVTALTYTHESDRLHPWSVSDAPVDYIDLELSGIVGIEVHVDKIEGKAKFSQNRAEADRRGVVAGLTAEHFLGADAVAQAMRDELDGSHEP